jgi:hypothetical protein
MAAKEKANQPEDTTVMDKPAATEKPAATDKPAATEKPAATDKPAKSERHAYDYTKLNTLAVVSLASAISWVGAVAGIVTGHIALAQMKRSGEKGRALAVTALVLGYLYVVGSIAMGVLMVLFRLRGWAAPDTMGGFGNQFGPGMMGGQRFDNDGPGMMGFNR